MNKIITEIIGRCFITGIICSVLIALAKINNKLNFEFGIILTIIFVVLVIWTRNGIKNGDLK